MKKMFPSHAFIFLYAFVALWSNATLQPNVEYLAI